MVDATLGYGAFAICSPLTRSTRSNAGLYRTGRESGSDGKVCRFPVRCRAHRSSRQRRKRGALPPVVPITALARQRAIDLLGHYTQRRPSARIISELAALLGRSPADKLMAGRWKDGLRNIVSGETYQRRPKRCAKTLEIAGGVTHIPARDSDVGRTFSILEVTRRILARDRKAPSAELADELTKYIGTCPRTEREADIVRKEVARRVARRKKLEVLQLPERFEEYDANILRYWLNEKDLEYMSMHLGLLTRRPHIGNKQARKLKGLLGELPRNKNVARSWKKVVDARRRKMRRKRLVKQRLAVADAKRRQRRRWKAAPEWTKALCRTGNRARRQMFKALRSLLPWKKAP